MASLKKYDNGLSLVTVPMKSTESVTVLILVGAGSRYETKDINGISHYLEHLFFKGGKKYKVAKEVSAAIDGLGGEMNAFTGKEYAGYYIKIASQHLDKSMDVLSDMLIHAQFPKPEVDKERGVIMEEYNMYQDTPMYQVQWDFEKLVFGDQPLGWDEVGTREFIGSAAHEHFMKYKKMLYTPDNTVINVAGMFDKKMVEDAIDRSFQFENTGTKGKIFDVYQQATPVKNVSMTTKKTEQAHLVLGVESIHYHDPRRFALQVLSTVLGGNMSSRMFQKVREERGLAYYVQTSYSDYNDTGVLYTRAGVSLKDIYEVVSIIRAEYDLIQKELVTDEELQRAKEYLKGKMVLQFEDSENVAHFYGKQQLLLGKFETIKETQEKIDAVTKEDVLLMAQALFLRPLFLSVIGPYENEEKFAELLK